MSKENSRITEAIAKVILPLEQAGAEIISPHAAAVAVIDYLDPNNESPPVMDLAARLWITDAARKYLAKRHDPVAIAEAEMHNAEDQGYLFDGVLQPRYPVNRDGVISYALKELCSDDELRRQSARMRKTSTSLVFHADALDDYIASRSNDAQAV